jgi:hydrogenase maturation protease
VLALGNVLHSDDGLGPRALERLRRDSRLPQGVEFVEGGTLGLELLTYIWDSSYLLVLDAVDVGQPPGTVVRVSGEELHRLPGKGSVHQLGIADLMTALRVLAKQPPEVVLLGVQPSTTEWGTNLSPEVETALDSLLYAAVVELKARVQLTVSR